MTFLLVVAGIALWLYARNRRHQPGAGASAAARARQLRTPLVRIVETLGVSTRRGRQAARWQAGAVGERRTASVLDTLTREGWHILHDRALPRGRANVDHLAISPCTRVVLPDSKQWSARWPVTVSGGRLWHGDRDVTDRLNGLRHETRTVEEVLEVSVTPLVVMHGAPLIGRNEQRVNELAFDGIQIVSADRLLPVLRRMAGSPRVLQAQSLAARARAELPHYPR